MPLQLTITPGIDFQLHRHAESVVDLATNIVGRTTSALRGSTLSFGSLSAGVHDGLHPLPFVVDHGLSGQIRDEAADAAGERSLVGSHFGVLRVSRL